MEKTEITDALMRAMEKALETLAFVEAIPLNEDTTPFPEGAEPKPRTSTKWTRVNIVRPVEASVSLLLPPELATMLTMDMFGFFDDSEVTDEIIGDAMGELCNVLAGRVACELLGDDAEFELGLPSRGFAESDGDVELPDGQLFTLDYGVEGHTLSMVFEGKDFQ